MVMTDLSSAPVRSLGQFRSMLSTAVNYLQRSRTWRQASLISGSAVDSYEDCIFCLAHHPAENRIMIESKRFFVRYDNFPVVEGHVEIVPKRHVESFFDLSAAEVRDAYRLISSARSRLMTEFHPDGYTIGVNEGTVAGRSVDHLHIHLIPRYAGDVPDPRGGIRQIVPNCQPDLWDADSKR